MIKSINEIFNNVYQMHQCRRLSQGFDMIRQMGQGLRNAVACEDPK